MLNNFMKFISIGGLFLSHGAIAQTSMTQWQYKPGSSMHGLVKDGYEVKSVQAIGRSILMHLQKGASVFQCSYDISTRIHIGDCEELVAPQAYKP
jgi:hypothetical protein